MHNNTCLVVAAACLGTATFAANTAVAGPVLVTSAWTTGLDGSWNVPTNWDPPEVPDNDGASVYDVTIDNAASDVIVTLDVNVDINTLTIDQGDALVMPNSRSLIIVNGLITNDGELELNSTGSLTRLLLSTDTLLTSPAETGILLLTGTSVNQRIEALTTGPTLTHDVNHVIRGGGLLGLNTLSVNNLGLIENDDPAVALTIDPPTTLGMANSGTIRATAGATVSFSAGDVDNTGGLLEATDASIIDLLGGASITAGELTTSGSGEVQCSAGTAALTDILNSGLLRVLNGADPTLGGTITNADTVVVASTGSSTQVRIVGDMVLDGGGTVTMMSNFQNRLEALLAGSRLTNVDNVIEGAGQIGLNNMSITNQSLINANDPVTALRIDPPTAGDLTNESVLRASGGGVLMLLPGDYDNILGVIEALDGSMVDIQSSAHVTGGELTTEGTGVIALTTGAARLIDVLLSGFVRVDNSADPIIEGTITNTDTISMESTGSLTQLRIDGNVTLDGGGTFTMSGNFSNRLEALTTGNRLTNVDNTIQGSGQVGLNNLSLTNQSLILANNPAADLHLDPPTGGDFTNVGVFRASGGAVMNLLSGGYLNDGGVIEAVAGSEVEIGSGAEITGGELTTSDVAGLGSGVIRLSAGAARLTDLATTGLLIIDNGVDPILMGTIENSGSMEMNSTGSLNQLKVDGDVTLTGGGTLTLSEQFNNRIEAMVTLDRLINVDHTIQGAGQIGLNNMSCTNEGTIDATSDAVVLSIDPPTSGDFTNLGTLRASGIAGIDILAGTFVNEAEVIIDAPSRLDRTGEYMQTAGSTHVDGELEATDIVNLLGGDLTGDGLVDGDVRVDGGTVRPGASAGTLAVQGQYTHTTLGTLEVELGGLKPGTEHDVVAVDGDANLGGTLKIKLIDGFRPVVGDSFTIITTTGLVNDQFEFVDCASLYTIDYQEQAVVINVVGAVCTEDLDCTGTIGFNDLLILLSTWGPCPAEGDCPADIDGSGTVGFSDLLQMLSVWGPCEG